MNANEFLKKCEEFRDKRVELERQLFELEEQRRLFEQQYVEDVFANSGYMVGQKIVDEEGKTWVVSGAHEFCCHVYLSFDPAKKDGTMSKVTYIARGEPQIRLN